MAQTPLSNMFKLFSLAWELPTKRHAAVVASGLLLSDFQQTWKSLELPEEPMAAFSEVLSAYEGRPEDEVLAEIRRDYTRLFVVDKRITSVAEGVYRKLKEGKNRKDVNFIINGYSTEVQDFMRACAVVRRKGYNDSVDSVDNEWLFCSILATEPEFMTDRGIVPLDKLDEFIDTHIKNWVPDFSVDVIENARSPYYKALCALQIEFVKEF